MLRGRRTAAGTRATRSSSSWPTAPRPRNRPSSTRLNAPWHADLAHQLMQNTQAGVTQKKFRGARALTCVTPRPCQRTIKPSSVPQQCSTVALGIAPRRAQRLTLSLPRSPSHALSLTLSLRRPCSCDGPFPNPRSTMYYQLMAFESEVRACEALPAPSRAKPWTCACATSSLSEPHARPCAPLQRQPMQS